MVSILTPSAGRDCSPSYLRLICRSLATVSVITSVCTELCAEEEAVQIRVDEYIRGEIRTQQIPGLSLAVMRNGDIVLAKGYGLANVELQVPVKPETIFQSCSLGKQFTAAAVMMLAEDGKLALNDRIARYFPNAPDAWTNVTVRHLLTHTAGLTRNYPKDFDIRRDYTEDELFKCIAAIPLEYPPGERWTYSNLGYVTLGILIHKVSGEFYGDFLQKRIFGPLGMNMTRIISEEDIIPNRTAGYRLVEGKLKNQQWVSPTLNTTADGSLYLSVLDMAKWDAALCTDKLLKKLTLEQMWTPVKLNDGKTQNYGFGWSLAEIHGHRVVEHAGAWQGFEAYIARYLDEKLTIVVLANLVHANLAKIGHTIAALYNPELAPPATPTTNEKEPKDSRT